MLAWLVRTGGFPRVSLHGDCQSGALPESSHEKTIVENPKDEQNRRDVASALASQREMCGNLFRKNTRIAPLMLS